MAPYQKRVDASLEALAKFTGAESPQDLFSIELSMLLDEMKEDYETWDKNTPERFIFDLLVRRSTTAVVDYWETILMIIAANVEKGKDYELRMDMLSLVEHFLTQKDLHSTVVFYSEIILKMILIPTIVWQVGKPIVRIRKAAVVCLIRLVEEKLIEPEKVHESFRPMLNNMKGCLDEDYANDLRFAAVVALRHIIDMIGPLMEEEDHRELYTELIKRLDDA